MVEGVSDSIWLRPERSGRGLAPEYSRAAIAAAAVGLADRAGLPRVTMRAVAAAVGAGPASLYRYVATRDELIELMVDQVNGEFDYGQLGSGSWVSDLLTLAHQGRAIYLRHPWLLDLTRPDTHLGPRALDYLERSLAVMDELPVSGQAKLESIGLVNGMVRQLVGAEVRRQHDGQSLAQWQVSLAAYLAEVGAAGDHRHVAAAIAAGGPVARTSPEAPLFDRAVTALLTALLPT